LTTCLQGTHHAPVTIERRDAGRTARSVFKLAIACTGLLLSLSFVVTQGMVDGFDKQILILLSHAAAPVNSTTGPSVFSEAMAELTTLGGYAVLTVAITLASGFLVMANHTGAAGFMVLSIVSGSLASLGLKRLFSRARPDLVAHLDTTYTSSFPSGHATASALAYLTIAAVIVRFVGAPRLRNYVLGAAVSLALLVGLTRVHIGVHWPSDVVAGWLLGTAWACWCWLFADWLGRRPDLDLGESEA
jgi:undecaprenyl-diphosphatase